MFNSKSYQRGSSQSFGKPCQPRAMAIEDDSQRRFRVLLSQLSEEYGRGWQSRVARELGVSQVFVSEISRGQKLAGRKPIEAAIARYNISPDFFFGDRAEDGDYRDFVGPRRRVVSDQARPAVLELRDDLIWQLLTDEERAEIEGISYHLPPERVTLERMRDEALTVLRHRLAPHKIIPDVEVKVTTTRGRPLKR